MAPAHVHGPTFVAPGSSLLLGVGLVPRVRLLKQADEIWEDWFWDEHVTQKDPIAEEVLTHPLVLDVGYKRYRGQLTAPYVHCRQILYHLSHQGSP